jgi:hypothetical protein
MASTGKLKPPDIKAIDLDFKNLTENYLYGVQCLRCEPVIPGLSSENLSLDLFAKILEDNPLYKAVVVLDGDSEAIKEGTAFRKRLTTEAKVSAARVRLKRRKHAVNSTSAEAFLYIVPNELKATRP